MFMEGLILNENTKYHTTMKLVLDSLGEYVTKLNWRITWMQIGCIECERLFDNDTDVWISGETLQTIANENPHAQWIWGLLQGFDSSISRDEACATNVPDIDGDTTIWTNPVTMRNDKSEIEIEAFDSSMTIVVAKDIRIIERLREIYKNSELLSEYNQ